MISKIEINNFQSHKHTVIDFDSGVNVIVGQSDCGKSAILRALRFVIENRPAGDSVISHWAKQAEVKLHIGENVITRIKGKSKNEYWLNDKVYKAFGQSVPEEVAAVINMSNVNIQRQLDGPFLLNETPGEVAKHFNKLAHLEKIDTGMRNILSWIRKLEQSISATRDEQKELKTQYKQLSYVDRMEQDIEVLEDMEQHVAKMWANRHSLQALTDKIIALQARKEKYVIWQAIEKDFNPLLELNEKLFNNKQTHANIKTRVEELETISIRLQKGRKFVRSEKLLNKLLEQIEQRKNTGKYCAKLQKLTNSYVDLQVGKKNYLQIAKFEKPLNSLLGMQNQLNVKQKEYKVLKKWFGKYGTVVLDRTNLEVELEQMENKFHEEFPDMCPLCGTEIKK
jgi:exonuclease SbcC